MPDPRKRFGNIPPSFSLRREFRKQTGIHLKGVLENMEAVVEVPWPTPESAQGASGVLMSSGKSIRNFVTII